MTPRACVRTGSALGLADGKHFHRRFRDRFGFNPGDLRPIRS